MATDGTYVKAPNQMVGRFLEENQDDPTAMTEGQVQEQLSELVMWLEGLAKDQVTRKRANVEERWLDNLRAFHGRYDEDTETSLREGNKSRAYIKITRKKTNSWDARLSSLLFPTDDENWDIRPTPVPTLTEKAKTALGEADQAIEAANKQAEQASAHPDPAAGQQMLTAATQTAGAAQMKLDEAAKYRAQIDEARKRVEAMRMEMADQLIECSYASESRLVIRDACRLGTGVLKGPLGGEKVRGTWLETDDGFVYQRDTDPAPTFKWVDPWNYFPDMSAIRPEDREFDFERHLLSAKDMRKLVRERGFNATAVREILENRKTGMVVSDSSLSYLAQLRSITGTNDAIKDRYVMWEYHGSLACKQIAVVLRAQGKADDAANYEANEDPLEEMKVIIFFCEGKILKLSAAYPLDSGESLYSIFTLEPSEASIFGYGIPEIMSDSQKSMNGAWRMALDNAALSAGPQIFIDRDAIQPADNSWVITPRKIWYKRKNSGLNTGEVLEIRNIPNNVTEIMTIVQTARRFIDDETALPVQAEGEMTDNPNITATLTNAMSMASNITFRRVVKNFDDGITAPCMRRLYDWNMQHNSRDDIKGDAKVDARGSTALLQRELQAQMLLNIAQNWTTHPLLGLAIKPYDAIADSLRAAQIQPESMMVSRDEFEAARQQQSDAQAKSAESAGKDNPTVIAANVRKEAAQIDADSRLQVANIQRETELMQTAQTYKIDIEKLRTLLGVKKMELDHKERTFAAELSFEDQRQRDAMATGEKPIQSGGSL